MSIRSRVVYVGIRGNYSGEIIGEGRDKLGEYWVVRVSSRGNLFLPLGSIDHISKGSNRLMERAA